MHDSPFAPGAEKEREKALRAVLALVDSEEGILEHPVGGLVVKRLILSPLTIDGGMPHGFSLYMFSASCLFDLCSLCSLSTARGSSIQYMSAKLHILRTNAGRIGEAVWKLAQGRVGEIVKSKQGCYTLAALLAEDQPQSLRESVAAALANVDLPAETATGTQFFWALRSPLPIYVLCAHRNSLRLSLGCEWHRGCPYQSLSLYDGSCAVGPLLLSLHMWVLCGY